jgi:hypothetical protein
MTYGFDRCGYIVIADSFGSALETVREGGLRKVDPDDVREIPELIVEDKLKEMGENFILEYL